MTEKEVQDIFVEELAGKLTEEALMAAYERIAVQILGGLVGPEINDETWGLLKDTAYAKSRLCLIKVDRPTIILGADEDVFKETLGLYKHLEEVINYFWNNYDSLDQDKFKRIWPKETVSGLRDDIAKKCEKLEQQFKISETILFGRNDLYFLDQSFTWTLQAILGTELYKQFQEEFNQTLSLLRKYKTELLSPSA